MAQEIISADGTRIPYTVYGLREVKASVIILPAMGVRASFYRAFAHSLMDWDIAASVMEYRGLGDSRLRAGRRVDYGYKEHQQDVAALIKRMKDEYPDKPLYIAGHSFGGHLALMTAGLEPDSFDGIIMLASGTPWYKAFAGKAGRQIKIMGWLAPALMAILGYFPGQKLGFAGREARSQMQDWLQLAKHNRLLIKGVRHDLEQQVAGYKGRVLCLSFERDNFAPLRASELLLAKIPEADVDMKSLGDEDINGEATHFGWAKKPQRVTRLISDWLG